jgi:hypothetical protein
MQKPYNQLGKYLRKRSTGIQEMIESFSSYWEDYFNIAFQKVKAKFSEIYPAAEVGELPPGIVGLKNFVYALPCPVKILELRVDTERYKHIEDEVCQLIGYDFSKPGDCSVTYCGVVDSHDTKGFTKFLVEEFGLRSSESLAESFCRDLTTTYFSDTDRPDIHFQFPHYDVRRSPGRYVDDLLKLMSWVPLSSETVEKFWEKGVDYNALYGLAKDSILPMSRIAEKDPIFGAFVKLSGGEATGITIEDLQKHISDIQLIPQVPEAVKRVFRIAKDLYIFGYFRYSFFTVSAHYAYLALESVIKHRYAASLGDRAILTNPKGQQYEIRPPSWERIFEFCKHHRKEGWSARKIRVNGEAFPSTMPSLLNWLVDSKLVPKWERLQYDAGVNLRHSLSHLESPSVFPPSAQTLRTTAEKINRLCSNLATQG